MDKSFLFDLDETLVTGDVVKAASTILHAKGELDRIYTNLDVNEESLSDLPKNLVTMVFKLFNDVGYAVEYKRAIASVYYFVFTLQQFGNKVGILTSRPQHLRSSTLFNLTSEFPGILWDGGVTFCGGSRPGESKKESLEQLKPDYFFDDRISFCVDAEEVGVPNVVLIRNKYSPWNHRDLPSGSKIKILKCVSYLDLHEVIGLREKRPEP